MGYINGTTTANNGVFLTVEPNTVWNGRITLSAALVNGAGIQAGASAAPAVRYNGTGGNYLDGDIVTKLQLNTPAQVLGALTGAMSNGDAVLPNITIQARANPVTLTLLTGGATAACATAIGE